MQPSKTVEFLDALKARKGFRSDYQLWKYLGWTHTTLSKYRAGRSTMGDAHAMRMAEELGLPEAYVVACTHAERAADDKSARVWKVIADHFKSAAAIILIALAALFGGRDAHAAPVNPAVSEGSNSACAYIYYAKFRQLLRWLTMGLRTTFPAVVPA